MKKNPTTKWRLGITLLGVVFAFMAFSIDQDFVGRAINLSALGVMLTMIFCGAGWINSKRNRGASALAAVTNELTAAEEQVKNLYEDFGIAEDIGDILETEVLFTNAELACAYRAYRQELDRLYRKENDFRYVDISAFLNQEVLDQIADAPFNDLIGGSMTGLGILGTFVGLMIGLQDFDPSSAQAMMETIPPLIDGIKVAFLTSIFGVIFSLLYNIFYRNVAAKASVALEHFLESYYQYVSPRPDNDGFTQLIRYQQSQSESFSQLAEQISLALANVLVESVVPTFNKIEGSINRLSESLAKTHDQNMVNIANNFVEKMDEAMGGQMTHLSENIKTLCQWQDDTISKMQKVMDHFVETEEKMGGISTSLQESVTAMEGYTKSAEETQRKINQEFDRVMESFANMLKEFEGQQDVLKQILNAEKENLENFRMVDHNTEKHLQQIETMFAGFNQELLKVNTRIAEQSKLIVEEISKVVSEGINKSLEVHQQKVEANVAAMEAGQVQALNKIIDASEQLSKATMETMEAIKAMNQDQSKRMQADVGSLEQTQKIFVAEMQKASVQLSNSSNKMSAASEDLTKNLDKAMTHTYQEIDKQLADIIHHLSGTIADMRDIVERVPKLLQTSMEQTNAYFGAVEKMQKEILTQIKEKNSTK